MPEIWFPYLNIKIQNLDPVAFSLFGLDIYWYGIIITLGIFLGILFNQREAKLTGQNPENYSECFIYIIIVSIIFARLYYVIFSWDDFKDDLTQIFLIRNGGIAIYGGIIGAALTILVYTKIKKINFFKFTDTCVFGLLIGQIIGRWGNFVNREAFGGYTDSIFAMRYLKSQVGNVTKDLVDNAVFVNGVEYLQVHPTFLYESCWNLLILIILLIYRKNKKFDGELTAFYCIFYGVGRFWIEGLRTDALLIGSTNIAISQVVSVTLIIIFTSYVFIKRKKLK